MPQSLLSLTICSSNALGGPILGLSFVYVDQNEEPIHVGPWGMIDPQQRILEIEMGPDEYLYDLSGIASDSTLFWLKLVTNQHVYEVGSPVQPNPTFNVPLGNGKVVALFGCSHNDYLTALGIYVAPLHEWPVMIGSWGGSGGTPVDIISTPDQLKSVTVYSTDSNGGLINGISFTYIDLNGDLIHVGPWGIPFGQEHQFSLNQDEYVNDIFGTTADGNGVTSLKFTTNPNNVHGPFGFERGTAFSVPLPDDRDDNGAVVSFFGRTGDSLVALGVYVGLAPKP